jgi:hypothetical protein
MTGGPGMPGGACGGPPPATPCAPVATPATTTTTFAFPIAATAGVSYDATGKINVLTDSLMSGFRINLTKARAVPSVWGNAMVMETPYSPYLYGTAPVPVYGVEFKAAVSPGGNFTFGPNATPLLAGTTNDYSSWRSYSATFAAPIAPGTQIVLQASKVAGSLNEFAIDEVRLVTSPPATTTTSTTPSSTVPATSSSPPLTAPPNTVPAITTTAAPTATFTTTTTSPLTTTIPPTTAVPTTTTTAAPTTTLPPFPIGAATAVLDAGQAVPILNETLNAGFRYAENGYSTPAPGQLVPGHTGSGLRMNAAISGAIYGSSTYAIRGIEFWAKAPADPLTAQWNLFGPTRTPLIADGTWRRYITQFPTDIAPGTPLRFQAGANGTGNKSLDIDDIRLITAASPELTTTTTTATIASTTITTTTTIAPTTTTIAKFPAGPAPVTDAQGGIVIVSESLASGFAFARDGSGIAEPTLSNVAPGRSGLGLVLGGADSGMVVEGSGLLDGHGMGDRCLRSYNGFNLQIRRTDCRRLVAQIRSPISSRYSGVESNNTARIRLHNWLHGSHRSCR